MTSFCWYLISASNQEIFLIFVSHSEILNCLIFSHLYPIIGINWSSKFISITSCLAYISGLLCYSLAANEVFFFSDMRYVTKFQFPNSTRTYMMSKISREFTDWPFQYNCCNKSVDMIMLNTKYLPLCWKD